jgi:hypothetical protein
VLLCPRPGIITIGTIIATITLIEKRERVQIMGVRSLHDSTELEPELCKDLTGNPKVILIDRLHASLPSVVSEKEGCFFSRQTSIILKSLYVKGATRKTPYF